MPTWGGLAGAKSATSRVSVLNSRIRPALAVTAPHDTPQRAAGRQLKQQPPGKRSGSDPATRRNPLTTQDKQADLVTYKIGAHPRRAPISGTLAGVPLAGAIRRRARPQGTGGEESRPRRNPRPHQRTRRTAPQGELGQTIDNRANSAQ